MRKTRSNVVHISGSDAPRDHFYIGVCNCGKVEEFGRAPLKSHKEMKTHARRAPGHVALVIDMTLLRQVARYQFERLDFVSDADQPPPF
jgi:hypothetical protein